MICKNCGSHIHKTTDGTMYVHADGWLRCSDDSMSITWAEPEEA